MSYTQLLIKAATAGDANEVKRLIPHCNPRYDDSLALQRAVAKGDTQCVALLLPVSDPKAGHSYALQLACHIERSDLFDLLYPLSDPAQALAEMMRKNWSSDKTKFLTLCVETHKERNLINNSLECNGAKRAKKKM